MIKDKILFKIQLLLTTIAGFLNKIQTYFSKDSHLGILMTKSRQSQVMPSTLFGIGQKLR